jgi:hypothetical protein
MAIIKITKGYSFPIQVLFRGNHALDHSMRALRMTSEQHGWKIYKQTEFTISGGPYSFVDRALAHASLQPKAALVKSFEATFDLQASRRVIMNLNYGGARDNWSHSKSIVSILCLLDSFWECLQHYSNTLNLNSIRLDSFLREQDYVDSAQQLFVSEAKLLKNGSPSAQCPACATYLDISSNPVESVTACPICNRIFIVRPCRNERNC